MHLTLLVPGLLWPREILRDTTYDLPLPALSRLLGCGHVSRTGGDDLLAQVFGTPEPLPAAALRLLGAGGEPGDGLWLCLDPVHLSVAERSITLDDPARLVLSADEDAALRKTLAPLFGEIVAPQPGRWHLRLEAIDIATQPLPSAVGRAVDPALPGGTDAQRWRQLLAEAQTLLHDHPVNCSRAENDHPLVNSLWPWGEGHLPGAVHAGCDELWGNGPVLQGLAKLAGAKLAPLPPRFQTIRGNVLAHADHLTAAPPTRDAMTWREALTQLESEWVSPALVAMKGGALRRLTFVATGEGRTIRVSIGRSDLWCFWRKPLPLAKFEP